MYLFTGLWYLHNKHDSLYTISFPISDAFMMYHHLYTLTYSYDPRTHHHHNHRMTMCLILLYKKYKPAPSQYHHDDGLSFTSRAHWDIDCRKDNCYYYYCSKHYLDDLGPHCQCVHCSCLLRDRLREYYW